MSFPKIADRVKDTSTTATSGTITLANSAPSGFITFGTVFSNLDVVYYCIAHQSANQWEIGYGTYTASGTTLSRDQVIANSSGTTSPLTLSAGTKDVFCVDPACAISGNAIYGSGTDGSVVFDGTTTILGFVPSSSVYTMTRDIFCSGIIINAGVTVKKNNYRVFNNGILSIAATGSLNNNGNNAVGVTGGAQPSTGTLKASGAPGANGLTVVGNGASPSALISSFGGAGGNGGSDGGGHSGGSGGTINNPGAAQSLPYNLIHALEFGSRVANNLGFWLTGGSGGSGGFATGTSSGGGACGGGPGVVVSKIIINNGSIACDGGNGGNAIGAGNAGGGGAGGGGFLSIVTNLLIGNLPTCNHGTAGTGIGTGASGLSGSAGIVNIILNV